MFDDLFARPLQAVWLTAALTLVVAVAYYARRAARRPDRTPLQASAEALGAEDRAADAYSGRWGQGL